MKSHGKSARIVKCGWCDRPYRVHVSDLKRNKRLFCSRHCLYTAWRAFRQGYVRPRVKELQEAA